MTLYNFHLKSAVTDVSLMMILDIKPSYNGRSMIFPLIYAKSQSDSYYQTGRNWLSSLHHHRCFFKWLQNLANLLKVSFSSLKAVMMLHIKQAFLQEELRQIEASLSVNSTLWYCLPANYFHSPPCQMHWSIFVQNLQYLQLFTRK